MPKRIAGALGPITGSFALAATFLALATAALGADASRRITPAEVAAWQERGEPFFFVDTRPAVQFGVKHARGALSVPAFAVTAKPVPRAAKVVLYDNGAGSSEAEKAAAALRAKGHSDQILLEAGLSALDAQG
jgi:rhodanese-related sulfurtransferase